MEIYLFRHFQTYGNTKKQYIGTTDEPLYQDEKFFPMVEKRREEIAKHNCCPDILYVSPMKRCIETASWLFPEEEQVVISSLRECDFGLFEGKNYEELKDMPEYQVWLDSRGTIPFPEGEAHEAFQSRCVCGFETAVNEMVKHEKQSAVFVVHGGTIMSIMEAFSGEAPGDFYHWQVKNGAGYRVVIDNQKWNVGIHQFEEISAL